MKKPIIYVIDDDPQVLRAVVRDIRKRYRKNYQVFSTSSAQEALDTLPELKLKNEHVALFLSDQRMPEMLGVEFLESAKNSYPTAKRVLLTAYSDTEAAIKAINDVQLDYYLMKPWDPPEERLFPILDDLLEEWQANFIPDKPGIKIIGYQWSPLSHEIKDFLSGNMIPYQFLDIQSSDKAKELISLKKEETTEYPVLIFEDGTIMANPGVETVSEKIGFRTKAAENMYDVVIIGAGPSGLAAGVYGGSEGLKTLLIEKRAPGGQAGTSSRIENYLGFPKGLSGSDLARRAITQVGRFGVEFLSPQEVTSLRLQDQYKIITLADGNEINTKSVIIATGVDYRKLSAKGVHDFTGAGVYYGAATTEATACKDQSVYIVGGGNSAGQGAMYLSKFACDVYIVIRKPDLSSSMSQYLIDQIDNTKNIHLIPETSIVEACGDDRLRELVLENKHTKEKRQVKAGALFIFIGARPYTEWMGEGIVKNDRGFIETGRSLLNYYEYHQNWKQQRDPYMLETSIPGIFAAGDVRAGAMNRVASAVGEGSMAISFVHKYLEEN